MKKPRAASVFEVVVETPKGSRNKYEFDHMRSRPTVRHSCWSGRARAEKELAAARWRAAG